MKCSNCNNEIENDAVFCKFCGEKVTSKTGNEIDKTESEQSVYAEDELNKDNGMASTDKKSGKSVEKTKKSHKKLFIVLLFVIVVLGAAFIAFNSVPKNRVTLAVLNTGVSALYQKSIDEKVLGLNSFAKTIAKRNSVQTLALNDGESEINVEYRNNGKKQTQQLYTTVNYDDDIMADMYLFRNADKLILGFPELYDDYIYDDPEPSEQFNLLKNQLLSENFSFEENDDGLMGIFVISLFANMGQIFAEPVVNSAFQMDFADLYKNMQVSKAQSSQIKVGNETVKCKGYDIVIPSEYHKRYLENLADEFERTDAMVNMMDYCVLSVGSELTTAEKKELRTEFETFLENCQENASDLKISVYLYRGKIVSCECKINSEENSFKYKLSLFGKSSPLDNAEASVKIETDNEYIELSFKMNTEYDSKSNDYKKDITFKVAEDSLNVELELKDVLSYNSETGALQNKMNISSPDVEMQVLKLNADVQQLKKGKSAEININKLIMGNEDYDLTFKGTYTFDKNNEKIEAVSASTDASDLSDKEIDKIVSKITEKFNKNMSDIEEGAISYYYKEYSNYAYTNWR